MVMMIIPIVVTLLGIVTAVSPVHPAKACPPNDRNSLVQSIIIDDDDDDTYSSDTSRNGNRR